MDVHLLLKQHKQLLDEWRLAPGVDSSRFVRDGAVDPQLWCSHIPRVLLLAKESHDKNSVMTACGYDLTVLFRNSADNDKFKHNRRFENNVGRWAYLIQCAAKGCFPDFGDVTYEHYRKALLQSAVTNLKKIAGGGKAKFSEIRAAGIRDKGRILNQISILDPTFVVFGRDEESTKLIKRIIGDLTLCCDLCYRRGSQFWIRHWHPCHTGKSDPTLYAELSQTLRRFFGS